MKKLPAPIGTRKSGMNSSLDLVAIGFFLAVILYTVLQWNQLPDQIPAHFNIAGEVDNYGSKWLLMLLPMIGGGLFALLTFLERHPEWHNYPTRINERNAQQFYRTSQKTLGWLKMLSLLLIAYLELEIVLVAQGISHGLSGWMIGSLFAGIGIVIIAGVYQQSKIT